MPGHNYKLFTLCSLLFNLFAAIAQLVERWLPKPKVAGSSPVCRSNRGEKFIPIFIGKPRLPIPLKNDLYNKYLIST